jgi:hypothetical protein
VDKIQQKADIAYFFSTRSHAAGFSGEIDRSIAAPPANPVATAPTTNAQRVQQTWSDPNVAAARNTRDGVSVTLGGKTTTHKSTRDAFKAYNLPDSKHIKFRKELKLRKSMMFFHEGINYAFAIVSGE